MKIVLRGEDKEEMSVKRCKKYSGLGVENSNLVTRHYILLLENANNRRRTK